MRTVLFYFNLLLISVFGTREVGVIRVQQPEASVSLGVGCSCWSYCASLELIVLAGLNYMRNPQLS